VTKTAAIRTTPTTPAAVEREAELNPARCLLTGSSDGSYPARYGSCTPRKAGRLVSMTENPDRRKPALLVVEDDRLLRWSLREKFRGAGWEVLEAASGTDGLSAAAGRPVDLALLAGSLPDVAGEALAARLSVAHPECRVILMGPAAREDAVAPRSSGWPTLEKPFDLDALVRWAAGAALPTG
jgi:CheY-like chemotaxis protein